MFDTELCREAYREMYRAMIAKDHDALDNVLDDSFVLVHMTGMRQDKRAFIKAVVNGTLNYYACKDDSIDVQVDGDRASLVGRSRVNAAVFGGGKHTWRLELDMTLVKQEGRWRVAFSQAGTY